MTEDDIWMGCLGSLLVLVLLVAGALLIYTANAPIHP